MMLVAGRLLLGGAGPVTLAVAQLGNLDVEVQPAYDVELGEVVVSVETVDPLTVCLPG